MACLRGVHGIGSAMISMDSYHHYNAYLKEQRLGHLKGSAQTINAQAMLADLNAVMAMGDEQEDILLPVYDRQVHDPVPNRCAIRPPHAHPVIFVEGLHLLRREKEEEEEEGEDAWSQMRQQYTECWFLRFTRLETQRDRVLARKVRGGTIVEAALEHFERVDAPIIRELEVQAQHFHEHGVGTSLLLTFDDCNGDEPQRGGGGGGGSGEQGHTPICLSSCEIASRDAVPFSSNCVPGGSCSRTTFSLLTYNIWFHGSNQLAATAAARSGQPDPTDNFVERMDAVANVILATDADVVCLQECTPWSFALFSKNDSLTSRYDMSKYGRQGRYGVSMLVRKGWRAQEAGSNEVAPFVWTEMPTMMGRSLLSTQVRPPSLPTRVVHVSTAHFESLASARTREEQLKVCACVAAEEVSGPSIVAGDFNFCSYRNYNDAPGPLENDVLTRVLPDHTDVWPSLAGNHGEDGGDLFGYTFDSERNSNIQQAEQMRYDRILFRDGPGGRGYATSAELVGMEKIVALGMHPSDHFGVLCRFRI
jgi:endonuclease/exonuclease/phosphatase family metal-dependent hydrolase